MTLPLRRCETCHWWGRHELSTGSFRPCRFPLPESVVDYMDEMSEVLWSGAAGTVTKPALMKRADGGRNCDCWHPFLEYGGRYIYGLTRNDQETSK